MRHATVDASVVIKWFKREAEQHRAAAVAIRHAFERGELALSAPSFLGLELVNALGRRWAWEAHDLRDATVEFLDLGLSFESPDLLAVGRWVGQGLSAYDAAYVAVAEQLGAPLVTADERVIEVADGVAVHLSEYTA